MTTPVIGEGEKLINIVLLSGERLHVRVHANARGQHVFDQIVRHISLSETHYFGLMIIKDGEQQFLNLDDKLQKLAKYAPHLWKDDSSCNSSLVFTIFLRVKYYVENICLLQHQQTRHQYYLQLRKDVLENSIRVHDDTSMVLASYALQAELGDFDKALHGSDYFIPQHYLPAKTIAKLTIPYIKSALPAMHQSHRGLTEAQAEIEFLKEAQKLTEYGVIFHRVFKKEYNKKVPYSLGICVRGLIIYEETGPVRNVVCKHPWPKIKKMSFKRRKFIIEAENANPMQARITLYTANYKRSRYLLKMSSGFFHFHMMMSTKLAMLPEFLPQEDVPHPQAAVTIPSVRIQHVPSQDSNGAPEQSLHTGAHAQKRGAATSQRDQLTKDAPPKSKPRPEAKSYNVDLQKKDGSFGFTIVGGIELGGIFVKDVTPGGAASQAGNINAGDRIVQVNKTRFENVTRREAINALRNAPERSKFIMETFGQNLVIEADASIMSPLAVSAQSLAINHPQIPVVSTGRESEFIRVDLQKRDGSFGIGFTGGPELGGVYIKSVLPGGAAEADGRIAIGDRVIEVDGINVEGFSRRKIQDLMKNAQGSAVFVIERLKQIPATGGLITVNPESVLKSNQNFIAVNLQKKNDSLGFSITGGLDLGGVFVKYLNPNGPANLDGRLEIGDRIVAVNSISLETVTRQQALEIIRGAGNYVNLIVEKCITPAARSTNKAPGSPSMPARIIRTDSIKSLPTHGGAPRFERQLGSIPSNPRSVTHSMYDINNASVGLQQDVNANYAMKMSRESATETIKPLASKAGQVREVFVVDLPKQNGSFGISLTGGAEVGGIYVKDILPNSSAHTDGRISKGDRIVEINARRMDDCSRQEATDWLKACQMMATLVLERFTPEQRHSLQQQNQPSSQFSSFDGEFISLELSKKNNSFGLNLMGGPELRGIYLKRMLPGGAAQTDGRLNVGDRLVEINGISVDGLTHTQATDLLKQTSAVVNLLFERPRVAEDSAPSLMPDTYQVELRKGETGFGLSLTGGGEFGGIFVKGLVPGGPADLSGKISKGDRLIDVNGISMDGLTRPQAIDVLRKAPSTAQMLLEKQSAFDNVLLPESEFFLVELYKKQNGYGLSLTGGPEIDGVYVKSVQHSGAADHDGRIQRGDRLVTINGRNVENLTKQKCAEMLKACQDKVTLLLERCVVGDDVPPLDTVLTVVEMVKGASGFGLNLTGGPEIGGIFVKALLPNGGAEKDGRILIGDRVVEMNGISLDGFTPQQASELLKNCGPTSTFVLERYKQKSRKLVDSPSRQTTPALHRSVSSGSANLPTAHSISGAQLQLLGYNGVSPAVPPRHVNSSGIPSKESAFKRLEQQQQADQQRQDFSLRTASAGPVAIMATSPSAPAQLVASTPARNPSAFPRQGSTDYGGSVNDGHRSSPDKIVIHPSSGAEQSATYGLVESSVRALACPMSSVARALPCQSLSPPLKPETSTFGALHSRIPLGPISSAIFGSGRDARETVICMNNGRPIVQTLNSNSSYSAPTSSGVAATSTRASDSLYHEQISSRNDQPSIVDSTLSSTRAPGLKWISLNSSNGCSRSGPHGVSAMQSPSSVNSSSSSSNQGSHLTTDNATHQATSSQQFARSGTIGITSNPSVHSGTAREQALAPSVNNAIGLAASQTTRLQALPPAARRANFVVGDYIFEVILFKGASGLGMNLSGGGSDGPVVVNKIAKGTTADEGGQLRMGDVLLEVNGKDVGGMLAREVIALLRSCSNEVQLLVKRPAFAPSSSAHAYAQATQVGL